MNQESKTLSEDFLKTFSRLLYMVKIHEVTNSLLMECIDDFKKVVDRLLVEDNQVVLQVARGNLFLQNEKVLHRREIGQLMNVAIYTGSVFTIRSRKRRPKRLSLSAGC
jgi:hypothetical protein